MKPSAKLQRKLQLSLNPPPKFCPTYPRRAAEYYYTLTMATIGIISIGEMGLGIAQLLKAHQYRVVTNASDRRQVSITGTKISVKLTPFP
jgi:hypothetical protein